MKNAVARLQRRLHDCETLSHGCKANYTTARRFRTPATGFPAPPGGAPLPSPEGEDREYCSLKRTKLY